MSPRPAELLARAREGAASARTLVDARAAHRAQARREASDYAAETFELVEAVELVATAERFVAAVERLTS